ncbi:hypothetical protein Lser_V15G20574 [Lactuca serriola]|uniref:Uncharacterized protein n=1 Tax=Lactuca sativa TaxID=4236 RepID=A0A9R1VS76_LACSA|nr:hypothetical protein LSAT_V11C400225680 [Lactuca sativa]
MGIQIPLRKKVTLIPNSMSQRDCDEDQWTPIIVVIIIPNFTHTISKAISNNNNSFAIFFALLYVGFGLSRLCLSKFISLPKHEKLMQQLLLKLDSWFLTTVITFGFVYRLAETMAMYIVVSVGSLVLFVMLVIDLVRVWKIWRHGGEDETPLPEDQTMDDGKFNGYSVSILDKV